MNFEELKRAMSMKYFVETYCKKYGMRYTPYFRQKMRGVDGNGKERTFTEEEKEVLKKGVAQFLKAINYEP